MEKKEGRTGKVVVVVDRSETRTGKIAVADCE